MLDYGVSFVAHVVAWDATNNTMKTGDSANIVLKWNKDGTSTTTTNACSEVDATNEPGLYKVTITATEAQCILGRLGGKSSSSGIVIIPIQYSFIKVGAPAGASLAADLASVKVDTGTTIPGRLPAALSAAGFMKADIFGILATAFTEGAAGRIAANFKTFFNVASATGTQDDGVSATSLLAKFSGITLVKHWLGMLAGKQAADATALTELKASGAGSGTYDPTTDALEALRDRGDAAWITASGFSTLDAAGIRTAVGLASANLDTQLAAIQAQVPADLGATYNSLSNVQATKVMLAILAGPSSGLAGATAAFKKLDGSGGTVLSTGVDADGNRGTPTITP